MRPSTGARGPATGAQPRARLLAAAVEHLRSHGLSDLSLRELATAIGTSHRMLIYHFGSKEGLLVAVVQAVEAEQRAFLAELAANPDVGAIEAMRAMWRHLSDPSLWPSERLFFEIYSQALQGRPGTAGFLDRVTEDWVAMSASYAVQLGVPPETARADARLSVAVGRGLLLDLLATGDRGAADQAFERFVGLCEDALASSRGS
jgi:AcrR family transcriptional regulator